MKRIISALMTLLMLLSMLAGITLSASADYTAVDTATADDAVTDYSIASVSDLIWAAKNYAVFAEGDTLYLTADLDISQYDGDFAADFPGFGGSADANRLYADFDGQGHTIYNYADTHGLFKKVAAIEIRNVTLTNAVIGTAEANVANAGMILDVNALPKGLTSPLVTVKNVHIKDSTLHTSTNGGFFCGNNNARHSSLTIDGCSLQNSTVASAAATTGNGLLCGLYKCYGSYKLTVKNTVVCGNKLLGDYTKYSAGMLVGLFNYDANGGTDPNPVEFSNLLITDNIVVNSNSAVMTGLLSTRRAGSRAFTINNIVALNNRYGANAADETTLSDIPYLFVEYGYTVNADAAIYTDGTTAHFETGANVATPIAPTKGLDINSAVALYNNTVNTDWTVLNGAPAQAGGVTPYVAVLRFPAETIVMATDPATGLWTTDAATKAKINAETWIDSADTVVSINWSEAPTASLDLTAYKEPSDRVSVNEVLTNTEATQFSISSLNELIFAAKNYAAFTADDTVYLETDLDIADYNGDFAADFPGLGVNHDKPFPAAFNGLNHTIYNYTDTHAFMAAAGAGGLKNLKFEGGTVTLSTYGGFVLGFGTLGADLTGTISNVHVKNATVNAIGTGYGVAIMAGGCNNKARHITFENCSVEDCTVHAPDLNEMAGIFFARLGDKATGSLTMNNIVVADSTLISNNQEDSGGGLLIADVRRPGIGLSLSNIAMIGNRIVNTEDSQASIITNNGKFAWTRGVGPDVSNIVAMGNLRSIDGQQSWAPIPALFTDNHDFWTVNLTNAITDEQVKYEVLGHSKIENVSNIHLMNTEGALAALNATAEMDWTVEDGAIVPAKENAPVTVTFTFTDGKTMRLGTVNGTLTADAAAKAMIDAEVWNGFDWSNSFTADTAYTAAVHTLTYTKGNGTHTVSCADCGEAAHNGTFPCAELTDGVRVAGNYYTKEHFSFTCRCGNQWTEEAGRTALPVCPLNLRFRKESYNGDGALVELMLGSRSDTNMTGFKARVQYDGTLLRYLRASSPYTVTVEQEAEGTLLITLSADRTLNAESIYLWFETINPAEDTPTTATMTLLETTANEQTGNALIPEKTASTTVLFDETPEIVTAGDLNEDNRINILDTALLLQSLSGTLHSNQTFQVWAADVDGDAEVTVNDLTMLLRYLVDPSVELVPAPEKPAVFALQNTDYAGYPLPAEDTDYAGYLKVMTYNLKMWNNYSNNLDECIEFIKSENPDIVGFQEIDQVCERSNYVDHIKELAEQCGYPYYHFAKNINKDVGQYGNAFMSKYPIDFENVERVNFAQQGEGDHNRSYCHYPIEVNGKTLHVFNAHVTLNADARPLQIQEMQADAAQYDYAIMIGDYNHKAQLMVDILDHKAFMALNGGLDFETAINTFSSAEPTSAIDNIIVSRKLSYYWNHDTNVGVETSIQPYISDHNCLYTWIKLPA